MLFKRWLLFKRLSGNNYAVLYPSKPRTVPRSVDDAKKYAVILPDVVINMWEITTAYYYRREKEAVVANPKLYTIVTVDPRFWLYGSHSSHYPNVSWQPGPSTNSGKRSEKYQSYLSERRARKKKKKETSRGREGKRRRKGESCKNPRFFSFCEKSKNKSGPRVDASHEATIYQKLIIH